MYAFACDICAEEKVGKFSCSQCNFRACRPCMQRYAMDSVSDEPSCARCGVQWNSDEQIAHLTARFIDGPLRNKRRRSMVNAELARMESAMPAARKEWYSRQLRTLIERAEQLTVLWTNDPSGTSIDVVMNAYATVNKLQAQLRDEQQPRAALRCASRECHGFLEGNTGICFSCGLSTCVQCGELAPSGHVCNGDTLRTVRAISEQCRPCAGCLAMTVRVEGCPVMWCAHCHSFWNWDTGELINSNRQGVPHNPDHVHWQRGVRNGTARETGDIPCGGIPELQVVYDFLNATITADMHREVHLAQGMLLARNAVIHSHVLLRPVYPLTFNRETLCRDIRIAYILNDIPLHMFERNVEHRTRRMHFKKAVGAIVETFTLAGAESLSKLVARDMTLAECMDELGALRTLANGALEAVAGRYHRKVPLLRGDWKWNIPNRRQPV